MERVEFYRAGDQVVVVKNRADLKLYGLQWGLTNMTVASAALERLRNENPHVEFVEIPPQSSEAL